MRIRGTLRSISNVKGLQIWLGQRGVLLEECGREAERLSQQLTTHAHALRKRSGVRLSISAPGRSAKRIARGRFARDGIAEGALRSSPAWKTVAHSACEVIGARSSWSTSPRSAGARICIFTTGTMSLACCMCACRPGCRSPLQVCVNGREWLVQQLRRCGSAFTQVDNCLFDVADLGAPC